MAKFFKWILVVLSWIASFSFTLVVIACCWLWILNLAAALRIAILKAQQEVARRGKVVEGKR
jgi:hypothetical protein